MQWHNVKNEDMSSIPLVKVFFTSLFLLIVLLLLVPLETNGATSCGNSCQATGDCPGSYLRPGTNPVCCYSVYSCGLALQCMYDYVDPKISCDNDRCLGNTWYYNAELNCTSGGWECSYETESCISCGCCSGACLPNQGCVLNANDANCPADGWVNSGSSYGCCSTDNQACTCQNQQYLDYYCYGGDLNRCSCKYNITDSRTLFSNCSACPAPGLWSTCSSCSYSSTCDTSGTGTQSRTTYTCSGGLCITDSEDRSCTCTRDTDGNLCGSSSCPSDICTGICPGCLWRDYPSSCNRYCSSSSCQSCSCSYLDRNPDDASSYCTGCSKTWDSTASKCCGDDGGTTDTWCNTGDGACVSGVWHLNHCSDGIQDCDETGVDVGGVCGCNLNRTGNITINFACILDGTHHLVNGNLTITSGGYVQMNANSSLTFDAGKQIVVEGTGYILKSASNTIIQQQ